MTHVLNALTDRGLVRSARGIGKSLAYDVQVNGVEYSSLAQAARLLNIPYPTVMNLANKPQPVEYKGESYTIIKGTRRIKTHTRFDDYVNKAKT
jgi:hypothetical protein